MGKTIYAKPRVSHLNDIPVSEVIYLFINEQIFTLFNYFQLSPAGLMLWNTCETRYKLVMISRSRKSQTSLSWWFGQQWSDVCAPVGTSTVCCPLLLHQVLLFCADGLNAEQILLLTSVSQNPSRLFLLAQIYTCIIDHILIIMTNLICPSHVLNGFE